MVLLFNLLLPPSMDNAGGSRSLLLLLDESSLWEGGYPATIVGRVVRASSDNVVDVAAPVGFVVLDVEDGEAATALRELCETDNGARIAVDGAKCIYNGRV
jgi:hypothetical protein